MQFMKKEPPRTFDFIINLSGGNASALGEEKIRDGLQKVFGKQLGELAFVKPTALRDTLQAWSDRHPQGGTLVVGGGDGSVLTAAEVVMGRKDITLGILPLGTHNLFVRQLGFSGKFNTAAKQLKKAFESDVDVGVVNGVKFLVGLLLDENSHNYYQAREDLRDKDPLKAMKAGEELLSAAVGVNFGKKMRLDVTVPGEEPIHHEGRIVVVSNNEMRPVSNVGRELDLLTMTEEKAKDIVGNITRKSGLGDGKVAFYSFRGNLKNVFDIIGKIWDGKWPRHASVATQTGPALHIESPEGAKTSTIVVDGELKEVTYPLDVGMAGKIRVMTARKML